MNIIEEAIHGIAGGRVLDVATQEGHFARILAKNLPSYSQIVGIDVNEQAIRSAQKTIGEEKVRFLVMDAEQMGFEDDSFDTVSISASFHHLSHVRPVLAEMGRALKPGGSFVLAEMHRDARTEAGLTSVYLHHWVAEVDTALGGLHHPTLARQELLDHVASLGLSQVECYDDANTGSDPMDRAIIEQLEDVIARVMQRAEKAAAYPELKQRGEQLRQRLHRFGAQREPVLVVTGRK